MAEPEGNEWEIWNDDGFVCKRRRRRSSKICAPADDHNLTADQLTKKNQKRKKKILMKLRDEYRKEIQDWQKLSNILSTMKTPIQTSPTVTDSILPKSQKFSDEFVCQILFIDELLLQAVILNLSNLCDAAEAMISLDKEQYKQSMMDIPLLGSPRSILVCNVCLSD
ncbi:hypothetical protein MKW94_015126 [Papaver nudicaule]|uniref:Uncharacterized protein n=1 Tax=Papaver nudicaule TaxID=74823 RepID=A0AA41S9P1_PAPNU|nr:hypothetical protein [Papaver nudicaule]